MRAFLTVGSTRFDELVNAALSQHVLSSLRLKEYTELVVQCGNSDSEHAGMFSGEHPISTFDREGVRIEIWKFKPSLQDEYKLADLVISHAGSGTILEVLRLGKPLIVIPNPTLLENHQKELATELNDLGHLRSCEIPDLATTIESFDVSLIKPFPPFDGSRFSRLLDEEMGYL